MYTILAVDPGLKTGLAKGAFEEGKPLAFSSAEAATWPAVHSVRLAMSVYKADLVVCESFIPRPGVRTWQPEALESIGALRYICQVDEVEFMVQSPADAKRFATNSKLLALGWRNITEGGHADDAARHLLTAAARRGVLDVSVFLR